MTITIPEVEETPMRWDIN